MELQQVGLEAALGVIVFGPHTQDLETMGYTIDMLRRAASMLEYRYAELRKFQQDAHAKQAAAMAAYQDGPHTTGDTATQPAPAARKRRHRRTASNGAAPEAAPPPPAEEKLFPADGAVA